ncbi:MAG: sulfotransferase domain-containing protein, partial [Nitrososphaeraceae archaeon]|nr:sulfotransferase domain-containing protein [Nitrososphaeraceae archaeon]
HVFMSWSKNVESWTFQNKNVDTLVLKYEDMKQHEEKAFKEIISFLDLPFNQERFNFSLKETDFKQLQKYEKEQGFVERVGKSNFFRSGKMGGWKKVLSKKQIDTIQKDHSTIMEKYGYI